ncbi:MAG: hypothetical protein DMD35_15820 [Gemmatimonadetes bacterium]|nr:MAG: hypothetical protein DMD35_15820 [Gemmatimonadota bacterium]
MRRMLATVCTIATVVLAGCGSDSSTAPTQASLAGTWNLTTVNGAALPFAVQLNPLVEILSDQLVLATNGTFTQSTQARFTDGATVTTQVIPDGGTYTLSGTAATFRFTDGSSGTATLSSAGNTFTVGEVGFSFVYTKQ